MRLAKTAAAGTATGAPISLSSVPNWPRNVPLETIITTTDYIATHSEVRSVMINNDGVATLQGAPLQYYHNGELNKNLQERAGNVDIGRDTADLRAAVGLLNRNIRIRPGGATREMAFPAADSSACQNKERECYFGGQVIARQGFKQFQMEGVELRNLGISGRLGHYPVHFHLCRNTSYTDAFVRSCSIVDSLSRFVTIHGTSHVTVADNVGYRSIGHGFYLEDGVETHNSLLRNLAVLAASGSQGYDVINSRFQPSEYNPRNAPGILFTTNYEPGQTVSAEDISATSLCCYFCFPSILLSLSLSLSLFSFFFTHTICIYHYNYYFLFQKMTYGSDVFYPSLFWISHNYNTIEGNMAVGVTACGACYWHIPMAISGPSRSMEWKGVANANIEAGNSQVLRHANNTCMSAMFALITVGETVCEPVYESLPTSTSWDNILVAIESSEQQKNPQFLPKISQLLLPSVCADGSDTCDMAASENRCNSYGGLGCSATIFRNFVTAFNYAPHNFASIWLRNAWFVLTGGVVSDQTLGGVSIVTGGDFQGFKAGFWSVVEHTVFMGQSQQYSTPFNSVFGPFAGNLVDDIDFVAKSLSCSKVHCVEPSYGTVLSWDSFAFPRLLSIYDGPVYQVLQLSISAAPI